MINKVLELTDDEALTYVGGSDMHVHDLCRLVFPDALPDLVIFADLMLQLCHGYPPDDMA